MTLQNVRGLLWGLLLIAGLVCSYLAWRAWQETTVIVEWATGSELETAGFNLYRSELPDGPYTKVNINFIPGAEDSLTGGDYAFIDRNVTPGVVYYYQLEEVETGGMTNRHGPIEVKAEGFGNTEFALASLAVVMCGIAVVSLAQYFQQSRKKI